MERIQEVRPVDIQVAQAEVDNALAAVRQAQADLDLSIVLAPQAGHILEIHARPGEMVDNRGIVELGETARMEVVAEVYQTNIEEVEIGQTASVTGDAFTGELEGKVVRIGSQVSQQDIFSAESGSDVDRRVVEVRIELSPEDSEEVRNLTNLQVQVTIK